jgi:NADPH2:quinone reductase
MRAATYADHGPSEVIRVGEKEAVDPGPGEVRVRLARSGCNPADWKARAGLSPAPLLGAQVPGFDGAGTIDAVGEGVDPSRSGERVWVWEAALGRAEGTAQESLVLKASRAVPLPDNASFDLGAALGVPFMTAHRCLTVGQGGVDRLGPGALDGVTVLVAGGAGAVGNAALQLARWSGATTITSVSNDAKAQLAANAGAHHVVNYRTDDVVARIRELAPQGIDQVVEVAPHVNAAVDCRVIAPNGTIAVYTDDDATFSGRIVFKNVRVQYLLVFTMSGDAKRNAVADVTRAIEDGAIAVGDQAGLPLHHFPLEEVGAAHDAMEDGAVGKVLIDLA